MKLKRCTTCKICGSNCLKVIGDFFYQYLVCDQERDGLRHEGKEEDSIFVGGGGRGEGVKSNKRGTFKILGMSGESLPQSPP